MRPHQRRAVPDFLLGGLDEAARQRVAGRLAGRCWRVRLVAQDEAIDRLLRGDLAVGGGEWGAQRMQQREPFGHDRATALDQGLIPESELVAAGLLLTDRAQQAVPLLEGAAVGREVAQVRGRTLAGQLVDRSAAKRWGT